MSNYEAITIEQGIVTMVSLNRPEVHNAINDVMIAELTRAFREIPKDKSVRLIVLRGNGKSFCAGADLNYMKSIAGFGFEENVKDAKKLAALFQTVYDCPLPTLAVIHGAAYGGANGLLAACDMVVAEENTNFAFSEVKLGIAPATISPFVIRRIGEFGAKELMMTGKRFKGKEAEKWHLVNLAVAEFKLDEEVNCLIKQILGSGPEAVKTTKKLIEKVVDEKTPDDTIEYTTKLIAELRASAEGQEGMAAFLEKRKPKWVE
ncbi:MAG: enoyl-CoA hydratase-related protein [Bacteroidales bacterium]|nr:enoyl-CoA hydratase-related protein [Bacteroidales bacterium]